MKQPLSMRQTAMLLMLLESNIDMEGYHGAPVPHRTMQGLIEAGLARPYAESDREFTITKKGEVAVQEGCYYEDEQHA